MRFVHDEEIRLRSSSSRRVITARHPWRSRRGARRRGQTAGRHVGVCANLSGRCFGLVIPMFVLALLAVLAVLAVLCCAMLCYAALLYAMRCDAMLCYAMLCYAMLCCAMLCYTML